MTSVLSMPSVTSMLLQRRPVHLRVRLDRARPARRRAGSTPSPRASSDGRDSVLATHSSPGSRARRRRGRSRPARTRRGRRRRRRAAGRSASPARRRGGPSQSASASSRSARSSGSAAAGRRLDLAAQRVERGELLGRDLALARAGRATTAASRRRSSSASTARVGRRGRVVDLVGEAGGQRAERDQGLALPRRRLDRAGGARTAPR